MVQILAAVVGTVAFALLYGVPRRYYVCCGAVGGIGWMVYMAASGAWGPAVSSFLATVAVVFLSRLLAVMARCPVTIFLVSGIFPLVPGAGIYWTVYYFVTEQLQQALYTGYEAIQVAMAIVLGIVAVFELPQKLFGWGCRLFRRQNGEDRRESR